MGVDIMELPLTTKGNKYLQDLFTKRPMAFSTPNQKVLRIARLLDEEIVPLFGVSKALLSDRLSILMQDVCMLLGIRKLNTTAPLSQTFKTMLKKHVAKFGVEWDTYLSGTLWAYCNTLHTSNWRTSLSVVGTGNPFTASVFLKFDPFGVTM